MAKIAEKEKYSFELNEEMLALLAKEFNIEKLVKNFAQAISGKHSPQVDGIAKEIFTRYGVDWIRRSRQLGDEYPDRTYEVLLEAIDSTGGHLRFPLLPQRVLEIAYASTQDLVLLPVYENSPKRLVYRVEECQVFQALKKECGENTANTLPCRYACLSACRALFDDLDYPEVLISMEASTNKGGYCHFAIARP